MFTISKKGLNGIWFGFSLLWPLSGFSAALNPIRCLSNSWLPLQTSTVIHRWYFEDSLFLYSAFKVSDQSRIMIGPVTMVKVGTDSMKKYTRNHHLGTNGFRIPDCPLSAFLAAVSTLFYLFAGTALTDEELLANSNMNKTILPETSINRKQSDPLQKTSASICLTCVFRRRVIFEKYSKRRWGFHHRDIEIEKNCQILRNSWRTLALIWFYNRFNVKMKRRHHDVNSGAVFHLLEHTFCAINFVSYDVIYVLYP